MVEAYPPADLDGEEQEPADDASRLFRAAPEDELIRLENFRRARERALAKQMRPIPVHMPPTEPEFRTGDPT